MAGENRNGVVSIDFGDGTHVFRLAIGQLEELQEKTGVGPYALWRRLEAGDWHTADVRETIRIGLIGGGMPPPAALKLVRRYIDDRPDWLMLSHIAQVIVLAAIAGAPEEEAGKSGPPEVATEAPSYQTDALPSEGSTVSPQPSVSR